MGNECNSQDGLDEPAETGEETRHRLEFLTEMEYVDEQRMAGALPDQQWKVHEYEVESDPSVISSLREKATSAAREAGARGDTLSDIQIAVGEALTNAYRHGSPKKPENRISLRCMTCPMAVVVEISDEGDRFDFDNCSDPDISQMRDHGMGIYLMRQAMDVVEFCCDCPGNRVRMIKWLL